MKIIIISGPSGSGKTTLSEKISKKTKNSIILSTDNYYKSGRKSKLLSKIIDCYFDRLISFNFNLLDRDLKFILSNSFINHSYSYDFKNKSIKKNIKKIKNIKMVIVEGIFAREIIEKYSKEINLIVQLIPNKETCLKRVIERDYSERGKDKIKAYKDFSKGWELFHKIKKKKDYQNLVKNILVQEKSDPNLILKIINEKN